MRIANVTNITVQYAGQNVLKGVSFEINAGKKLGLIGTNGSGKTTLLRILLGQETPTGGTVSVVSGTRIGYVPQYVEGGDDELVMDWLLAEYIKIRESLRLSEESLATAPPDEVDSSMKEYQEARDSYDRIDGDRRPEQAEKVLDSLGLQGIHNQTLGTQSGGEKNVLSLALTLLDDPDFLVLDEPGNHLDFMGLAWLEEFLINFKGMVLIVSHNRHTLDRVVQGILTLEDGRVKRYEGGYSTYRATHLRQFLAQQADYSANQKRLAQLEALVKRLELTARARPNPKAGKRLRARRSQLAREEAGRRKTDPGRFRDRRRIRDRKNPCEHCPAAAWLQQIVWRSVTTRKRRPRHHQRRAGGDRRTQRQRQNVIAAGYRRGRGVGQRDDPHRSEHQDRLRGAAAGGARWRPDNP